jgi:hypothetical protein
MSQIVTRSIGDGLDFACNLIVPGINTLNQRHPERASEILGLLCAYVSLRYAGEEEIAFEYLESLGEIAKDAALSKDQFEMQMNWLSQQLGYSRK